MRSGGRGIIELAGSGQVRGGSGQVVKVLLKEHAIPRGIPLR